MRLRSVPGEEAITVLSLIMAVLIMPACGVFIVHLLAPFPDGGSHGLVTVSMKESGDSVRIVAAPVGYASVPRTVSGFGIRPAVQDDQVIGSLQVSVTPLVGDFAIDMDTTVISIISHGNRTTFGRTEQSPVGPGEWAIVSKYGTIPYDEPGDDDTLHSGEIFDLVMVVPEPLHPYDRFTLAIAPAGAVPWQTTRTVPPKVTPVTTLGN